VAVLEQENRTRLGFNEQTVEFLDVFEGREIGMHVKPSVAVMQNWPFLCTFSHVLLLVGGTDAQQNGRSTDASWNCSFATGVCSHHVRMR
jgi:hypothetical protein